MANAFQQDLPGTAHLKRLDNSKTPISLPRPVPGPGTDGPAVPWRIILYIGTETITPLRLEVSGPMIVGRGDPAENYVPNIDLSPFGAQDAGVSRRHAVLLSTADGLYIRDAGSTNGTHVNGFLIQPNQPYRLRDGDKIELGQMHLSLRIASAPGQ
jgi:hypothetical protein